MSADQNQDLKFSSPYTPNTENDRREMLAAIGVKTVDDLFKDIPETHLNPELKIPDAISEMELVKEMESKLEEIMANKKIATTQNKVDLDKIERELEKLGYN